MTDSGWRTVQFFVSVNGVFEADVHMETSELRCNCPAFETRRSCRHTRWVKMQMGANGGHFPLQVSAKAKSEEAKAARATYESMRNFVLKYGKIEVL